MSLTREQIENWRKIVLSHWAADSSGKWLEREESKRQANALCDMALSALPAGHVAVPRELLADIVEKLDVYFKQTEGKYAGGVPCNDLKRQVVNLLAAGRERGG